MRKFYILYFILGLIFFLTLPAYSHHGGEGISGAGIAGPILTIPAYTLPKNRFTVGLISNYTNFDTFSGRELKRLAKKNEELHQLPHSYNQSLGFAYGITDDLSLFVSVPYVFKYGIESAIARNGVIKEGDSIGIGDITFLGQYRFYKNENQKLHAALLTGLKIPSGVRNDKNDRGKYFGIDSQPGTGSWDPQFGLSISKQLGSFSLDTSTLYSLSTDGVRNSNRGDVLNYNLAASYSFSRHKHFTNKIFFDHFLDKELNWDGILELNGFWTEKPRIGKHIEQNDGGTVIYLSPGIRLTIDHKWISSLAVSIPIIEDVNGRQKAPDAKLTFSFARAF